MAEHHGFLQSPLFHKIMSLASLIPGPQQPFVIGANLANDVGQNAYLRAHDPQYLQNSHAFSPGGVVQGAMSVLPGGATHGPLMDLIRRLQPQDQTGISDLMRWRT